MGKLFIKGDWYGRVVSWINKQNFTEYAVSMVVHGAHGCGKTMFLTSFLKKLKAVHFEKEYDDILMLDDVKEEIAQRYAGREEIVFVDNADCCIKQWSTVEYLLKAKVRCVYAVSDLDHSKFWYQAKTEFGLFVVHMGNYKESDVLRLVQMKHPGDNSNMEACLVFEQAVREKARSLFREYGDDLRSIFREVAVTVARLSKQTKDGGGVTQSDTRQCVQRLGLFAKLDKLLLSTGAVEFDELGGDTEKLYQFLSSHVSGIRKRFKTFPHDVDREHEANLKFTSWLSDVFVETNLLQAQLYRTGYQGTGRSVLEEVGTRMWYLAFQCKSNCRVEGENRTLNNAPPGLKSPHEFLKILFRSLFPNEAVPARVLAPQIWRAYNRVSHHRLADTAGVSLPLQLTMKYTGPGAARLPKKRLVHFEPVQVERRPADTRVKQVGLVKRARRIDSFFAKRAPKKA